jgi:hypothetical protein
MPCRGPGLSAKLGRQFVDRSELVAASGCPLELETAGEVDRDPSGVGSGVPGTTRGSPSTECAGPLAPGCAQSYLRFNWQRSSSRGTPWR